MAVTTKRKAPAKKAAPAGKIAARPSADAYVTLVGCRTYTTVGTNMTFVRGVPTHVPDASMRKMLMGRKDGDRTLFEQSTVEDVAKVQENIAATLTTAAEAEVAKAEKAAAIAEANEGAIAGVKTPAASAEGEVEV